MPDQTGALIAPYMGTSPRIAGRLAYAGPGATVLGRATLGKGAWLGDFAVIRADGHYVEIGDDLHLGPHATVHIAHEVYPTHIGNRVTAGPGAVIHACDIGDDCVIERGAVILDGSEVGPGAVVSAGSVVYPRSKLDSGWLYTGSPAKPVAQVSAADLEAHHNRLRNAGASGAGAAGSAGAGTPDCFVAPSARLTGDVRAGEGVGIWYGCILNAGAYRIDIGAGTNVQDNSAITCEDGDAIIAGDVTIGHNVTLFDCRIETNSLIGIGSVIAPGTVVEEDVLVAAGTETEPGQRLTAGQLWGGRPARPIRPMADKMRKMMSKTLPTYRAYAQAFRDAAHDTLTTPATG